MEFTQPNVWCAGVFSTFSFEMPMRPHQNAQILEIKIVVLQRGIYVTAINIILCDEFSRTRYLCCCFMKINYARCICDRVLEPFKRTARQLTEKESAE